MKPTLRKAIALLLLTVLVSVASVARYRIIHTPFDSRQWKAGEINNDIINRRWQMLNDLTSTHQLVGMSYKQVVALLGEGKIENESGIYSADKSWLVRIRDKSWTDRGGLDYFCISLDKTNHVTEYHLDGIDE